MKKVRFFPANLQNKKGEKGVPFVMKGVPFVMKGVPLVMKGVSFVTYHPFLNSLSKIIRDNMYLLNMNVSPQYVSP